MIKNIIFDLGRVIYTYAPRKYLLEKGYSGAEADALMKIVFDNPLWAELDRGTYTIAKGTEIMCRAHPEQAGEIRRILHERWVDELIQPMPASLDFFYKVKGEGYGIYILSNFGQESFARVYERDAFFKEADGMVISAHVKLIKPEKAIYEKLLTQYGLRPEACVFIDDNEDNIRAAQAEGIKGILFTGIEECIATFERMVQTCRNQK